MKLLGANARQPFVGIALSAASGIYLADWAPSVAPIAWLIVASLIALALILRSSLATYAVVFSALFLLHSFRLLDSAGLKLAHDLGDAPRAISVRGIVVTEPKVAPSGLASFLCQLESVEFDGVRHDTRATLSVRWHGSVEYGDAVTLFGTAEQIAPPRNPGELDMRAYLARKDVRQQLFVRYAENGSVLARAGGNPILRCAQKSRAWMYRTICRSIEDSSDVTALISGMVLGLRHQTIDDIEEPFQQTGTLHLFAVAGLHVGIVAQLLWIFATVARVPRKVAVALIIPSLLFYAAITGLHTSSVRAAVMSAVLLGGIFAERKVFALNSLAAAATILLCCDTNELFSIGFLLSFSVVGAIILLADPSFRLLRRCFEADAFLPRSLFSRTRRFFDRLAWWFSRASAVSFAAWIGSLPLMFWSYHLVTPISLFANLAVVPIAFCVLAGGLMSMVIAPVSSGLSIIFNNANWTLSRLILGLVHIFAQVPGGHFYVERLHWPSGARAEITVLDAGAGAAAHLRALHRDWLFDAGSERDYNRVGREYLRSRGIDRLDGLLLTHGDAGHIGGAAGVLRDFHPRELLDTAATDRSASHRALITLLNSQSINRRFCAAGDELRLSRDVAARVLFPPKDYEGNTTDDQAIVTEIAVAGKPRMLLMSDSGDVTEKLLLRSGIDLHSDIVIKGQHHSGTSCSPEFLDAVRPQVIIATSRDFPESERIKDDWAELLRSRGIALFRQDETGAVRVLLFRDHWEIKSFLTAQSLRSTSR